MRTGEERAPPLVELRIGIDSTALSPVLGRAERRRRARRRQLSPAALCLDAGQLHRPRTAA
ncbi:hypothetical protein [Saccharopolyspora kobensis]|uniref:hypothetical protein n=1 Tax=Saccharopolyspora kobensis TaxID=146035 RepID=UPI0033201200